MVTLADDSRVHVAVSAFAFARDSDHDCRRSALNAQLLLTVIFSFSHSISRWWSRSQPCVALYITGRSTIVLDYAYSLSINVSDVITYLLPSIYL
jgi:hypothetical protein